MNKSALIAKLAARFPQFPAEDWKIAVDLILGTITARLANGERVELRGFGSFRLKYRRARAGRNPMSGEKVQVRSKYSPRFKAGKELRECVTGK